MPGTVDDFMNRFASGGTIDDREAEQYHERFVSSHPDDRAFDSQTYHQSATEYLGKLPDDQFQEAARNAYSQAAPQERQGLLSGLLGPRRRRHRRLGRYGWQAWTRHHRSRPNERRGCRTRDELRTP